MTWFLLITLLSLKAGVPDQHQSIPQPSEIECEQAKDKFLKRFPRVTNPNWRPEAVCEGRDIPVPKSAPPKGLPNAKP